jgi:HAD superfamily phosphatase (TIGR01668 family)
MACERSERAVHETEESVEISGKTSTTMFRPDQQTLRITDVSLDALWDRGLRGIIVDLDNTVCAFGQSELAPGVRDWILAAKARGFSLAMVSNNFSERVALISAHLDVPAVPNALKPLPTGFLKALRLLGTPRAKTVVIGDQLFTDVLGAKVLGMHAVLTQPIAEKDFPLTRVLRLMERVFFARAPRG